MIGWLLRFLIFKPWGVVTLGFLILGIGVVMVAASREELPERSALNRVEGVLDSAVKITRGRSRTVTYELEIKTAAGETLTLTVPERDLSEAQVRRLLGHPVAAMYSGTKDVWELSSEGTSVITYDQTRQRREETQAMEAEVGPYMGGGGIVVSLLGALWLLRRRRAAERA